MKVNGLDEEDQVYFSLKNLYESFGYSRYKMRKFEEYSLYADNKNFLKSRDIITFSDRSGRLLALKPDVTLSIVKNNSLKGGCQKLYYRESVYRPDSNAQFKEISQIGLEYLGEVDGYAQLEVLSLAAQSLNAVGGGYVLDLSHMGVIEGIMEECHLSQCPPAVAECIKAKNLHDITEVCRRENLPEDVTKRLCALLGTKGGYKEQFASLKELFKNPKCLAAADELESLIAGLGQDGLAEVFRVDFSVINDASYYNGVVFQGYLEKFPRMVLSGGRYDNLVKKFNEKAGGMGFALYPDELSFYYRKQPEYDADILLLYGEKDSPAKVLRRAEELTGKGYSVRVAKTFPAGMKFASVENV
ncbi:MAG: ATP phosphoribosyltransferase regulatory subunit [Clostridia bacterium]|nr:ATP phosphoribosyltransferase regulatory subunit [Clostridia bacterium]